MGLNKILTILIILFILIFLNISLTTVPVIEDKIYPLTNNSNISSSEVLSFQNDVVSEYNKNFERYPPENKQLYHLFILNQSFNSTILLSYHGGIGFAFQENKTPITTITYWNQGEYGSFLGSPFGSGINLKNNTYYNKDVRRYGFSTGVYDLTSDYSKELAKNYYLLDYAQYLIENARLEKIEEKDFQRLNKAAGELIRIYQSGDELEKAKATLEYYQLAEEVGYLDASAKNILDDLRNKNVTQNESINETKGFTYTPFWHTGITAIYFLIMGFVFVRIERYKNTLKKQGKIGSVAYITHIFEGILALGGLAYFVYRSPSVLGFSQYVVIAVSIIIGMVLTLIYEKPNEVEQEK
jgi:hypothetical protein